VSTPVPLREISAAREHVIQALGVHFASDDLSVDELDRRLTTAIRATTREELDKLLADLPPLPDYARGSAAVSRAVPVLTSNEAPSRGFVGALMGGTARRGPWLVPQHLKAIAIMGGVELDLSAARFAPGVTEIEVFVLMGGVDVIVPHGVRVEALGFAIMGGFDASAGDVQTTDPDQPVIRITGFVTMGGVAARHKEPKARALKKFEKRLHEMRARLSSGGTSS
jgi:hypothetical protein